MNAYKLNSIRTETSQNIDETSLRTQNNVIPFPFSSPTSTTKKSVKKKNTKETKKENHTTDPIRDIEDVRAANQYFLSQPQRYKSNHLNIRNYTLFVVGCNSGRRIGDILKLRISDVLNDDFSFKPHIVMVEDKTDKNTKPLINHVIQGALTMYLNSLGDYTLDDYLFKSREGDNQPISYSQAWRIYKNMGKAIGLDKKGIHVATHTARKTWAYHTLNADPTNPEQIVYVSESLNHRDISTTRKYCGITQDKMDAIMSKGIY